MASKTTTRLVGFDTTGFVADRFAKIATTYTGGFTRVQYASKICTNVRGLITLPAEMKAISNGTYKGKDFAEKEALAMSYINHEMGHDDVELRLRDARNQGGAASKMKSNRALYEMVPPELKAIAMAPGHRIVLTSEWLQHLKDYGRHIALAYGGIQESATKQLATLCNAAEDPRQEALVGARWQGAKAHLQFGHDFSLAGWKTRADEMIASGTDCSFLVFAIGMVYVLHDNEQPFGPRVQLQVDACADLIDMYRDLCDWKTAHGYYDAVNFALASLSRVYRQEIPSPPTIPECANCGSKNLKGTMQKGKLTVICCDCGHREEMDVEAGESDGGESEMELDIDCDPESDDGGGEGDAEGDDSDDGGEESDSHGEAADEGAEGEEGGSGNGSDFKIEVGSVIRVKATGQKARVTAINEDGTIEAEPMETE